MNKERREIVYSVVTIILIPLLFVFNTLLIASRIQDDANRNIRRNADVINGVVAVSLQKPVLAKNYPQATNQIREINTQQPSIGEINVITWSENDYKIVAGSNGSAAKLDKNDAVQLAIIFERGRSVAKMVDLEDSQGNVVKGWNVITPIFDSKNKVVAAVSTNVSTADTQELIDNTLKASFIVTGAIVLLIIGLLFRHFRFASYAELLRKQKAVNQTMSDFLSVATHELKAPMTTTKGYVSSILDGDYGEVNERMVEPLNTVVKQTERLNNLVQDLLNVSHIEQGKITIEPANVDLSAIITSIIHDYNERAQNKGLSLQYEATPAVYVYADQGRVVEVMTNLIDNAIKYTPSGSVTIKHRLSGKNLITSIIDTGPGMSSEESSRLFQRFYRVKNDNTKGIPGTGLGLWIIKQYIEKMNGKISVNSIVGVGTEFTVELPVGKQVIDSPATNVQN